MNIGSHISLGIAMASRRFTEHGPNHVMFVFKRGARGMGGRCRGVPRLFFLTVMTHINEKAMTTSEGDSQGRM